VLHEGEILEQGTHKELMNMRGAYKALYSKQLKAKEILES